MVEKELAPDVIAGQAIYTRSSLRFYDLLVLGFSNRFVWRCPSSRLLRLYQEHVTANHLEAGVGTGYFLDRCRFPGPAPRLVLADLTPACLAATSERLARHAPVRFRANLLDPLRIEGGGFDSVGLNYVLHCLPGPMATKAPVVFGHLRRAMNPGATLFGSTLLSEGVPRGRTARRLMALYNGKGIFSNQADSLEALRTALSGAFADVSIETVGCAAIFVARV